MPIKIVIFICKISLFLLFFRAFQFIYPIYFGFDSLIQPSIENPSIRFLYCPGVSWRSSSSSAGQQKRPFESLFVSKRNPSPSHRIALHLSFFLPQKRKRIPFSYGSSL